MIKSVLIKIKENKDIGVVNPVIITDPPEVSTLELIGFLELTKWNLMDESRKQGQEKVNATIFKDSNA